MPKYFIDTKNNIMNFNIYPYEEGSRYVSEETKTVYVDTQGSRKTSTTTVELIDLRFQTERVFEEITDDSVLYVWQNDDDNLEILAKNNNRLTPLYGKEFDNISKTEWLTRYGFYYKKINFYKNVAIAENILLYPPVQVDSIELDFINDEVVLNESEEPIYTLSSSTPGWSLYPEEPNSNEQTIVSTVLAISYFPSGVIKNIKGDRPSKYFNFVPRNSSAILLFKTIPATEDYQSYSESDFPARMLFHHQKNKLVPLEIDGFRGWKATFGATPNNHITVATYLAVSSNQIPSIIESVDWNTPVKIRPHGEQVFLHTAYSNDDQGTNISETLEPSHNYFAIVSNYSEVWDASFFDAAHWIYISASDGKTLSLSGPNEIIYDSQWDNPSPSGQLTFVASSTNYNNPEYRFKIHNEDWNYLSEQDWSESNEFGYTFTENFESQASVLVQAQVREKVSREDMLEDSYSIRVTRQTEGGDSIAAVIITTSSANFVRSRQGDITPSSILLNTVSENIDNITGHKWEIWDEGNWVDAEGTNTLQTYTVLPTDFPNDPNTKTNIYKVTVSGTINNVPEQTRSAEIIINRIDDGPLGPAVVFKGTWESGKDYIYSENQRDVVFYKITPADTGNYYILINEVLNNLTSPNNATWWEPFSFYQFIASEVVITESSIVHQDITVADNLIISGRVPTQPYIGINQGMMPSYNAEGIFLGIDTDDAPKFSLKSEAGESGSFLRWDNDILEIQGNIGGNIGSIEIGNIIIDDQGIYTGSRRYYYKANNSTANESDYYPDSPGEIQTTTGETRENLRIHIWDTNSENNVYDLLDSLSQNDTIEVRRVSDDKLFVRGSYDAKEYIPSDDYFIFRNDIGEWDRFEELEENEDYYFTINTAFSINSSTGSGVFQGDIYSKGGDIGGWKITPNSLYRESGNEKITLSGTRLSINWDLVGNIAYWARGIRWYDDSPHWTAAFELTNDGILLQNSGDIRFRAAVGSEIFVRGGNLTSDAKLINDGNVISTIKIKKEIEDIDTKLLSEFIEKIDIKQFKYKNDGKTGISFIIEDEEEDNLPFSDIIFRKENKLYRYDSWEEVPIWLKKYEGDPVLTEENGIYYFNPKMYNSGHLLNITIAVVKEQDKKIKSLEFEISKIKEFLDIDFNEEE